MSFNRNEVAGNDWNIALTANSTATAFASRVPTTTKPAGASGISKVIEVGGYETLLLCPFGGNDNNDEFDVRVMGWKRIPGTSNATALWVNHVIMEGTAIINSSLPGIANSVVPAADLFADTFTVDEGIGVVFQSANAVPMPVIIQVAVSGWELIEIDFDLGTGGDDCNALWSMQ